MINSEHDKLINVGIVEDNNFLLHTYINFLKEYEDIRVVFSFGSIEQFERGPMPENPPDIVLLDIGLPGKSGLLGISIIKKVFPECKILLNSANEDKETILKGLQSGAEGYIVKTAEPNNIYRSILEVATSGASLSAKAALKLIQQFNSNPFEEWKSSMTKKEYEVLLLLKDGLTYKEIASILGITTFTVNQHTKAIYKKFNVHSRGELVSKMSGLNLPPAG